ncbi:MAG: hypothetical protein K9N06_06355 [Candidatus Cloacimonetes bacterium]|nr:hypothetical protein [Candidatus Cloacimonadota bacterium]
MKQLQDAVCQLFSEARSDKQIRSELDPENLSELFMGIHLQSVVSYQSAGGGFELRTRILQNWELLKSLITIK